MAEDPGACSMNVHAELQVAKDLLRGAQGAIRSSWNICKRIDAFLAGEAMEPDPGRIAGLGLSQSRGTVHDDEGTVPTWTTAPATQSTGAGNQRESPPAPGPSGRPTPVDLTEADRLQVENLVVGHFKNYC